MAQITPEQRRQMTGAEKDAEDVSGSFFAALVSQLRGAGTDPPQHHLAGVRYEDITVICGTGLTR
jgi:hypothetical protein